jgi:hypothetical protein
MFFRQFSLALLGLLLTVSSPARDRPFIDEPDNTIRDDLVEKEWKEGEVEIPTHYTEKALQEFEPPHSSGNFRYYLDAGSLQTGKDGVTRFILVIRSRNGVDNSSYEGMRCGEREYRVYAYGGKDGFMPMPTSDWRRIKKTGHENYRHFLYNDIICNTNTGKANQPAAVLRAMQLGRKVKSSPFL